ncbi:MAG: undecaprenyl/decaprenyl-phosphate alpha-N-acetylglucosaminyl 1-phosphate transferase [Prochlorococcus marinus CUG1439]|uniref:glycosyltransferase family 4 protein n=1 Tax=Prochlorococcus sp. MIT 1314 TaxID=3096220 RepID=UPI001B0F3F0F|nr:MraY family glycosyltransferase [Prochlorococcus sp. MIT 1314]MCR8538808.1 undecaprenyl/decaprenyl-phosphate alpha-N-acetylglucosaminyl 1-phosphate transferase [Prochlorococcus marinus CUG1439]
MYIYFFALSFISSFISLPFVKSIGHDLNIIDIPNKRKQHKIKLTRFGGISIFFGLFLPLIIKYILDIDIIDFQNEKFLLPFIVSISAFFCLGIVEDIYVLKPLVKLIFQILIAMYSFFNGIRIHNIDISFLGLTSNTIDFGVILSFIITLIWIVGITNAFNWLDGLDGLLSGITIIYCLALIFLNKDVNLFLSFISLSLIGSCIGFLRYNFYPAKMLMGDSGSFLLGSFLGLSSLIVFGNNVDKTSLNLPILFYLYPIADMVSVLISRLSKGNSLLLPDRSHLHYRLNDLGFSHKKTVLFVYAITILSVSLFIFMI